MIGRPERGRICSDVADCGWGYIRSSSCQFCKDVLILVPNHEKLCPIKSQVRLAARRSSTDRETGCIKDSSIRGYPSSPNSSSEVTPYHKKIRSIKSDRWIFLNFPNPSKRVNNKSVSIQDCTIRGYSRRKNISCTTSVIFYPCYEINPLTKCYTNFPK